MAVVQPTSHSKGDTLLEILLKVMIPGFSNDGLARVPLD